MELSGGSLMVQGQLVVGGTGKAYLQTWETKGTGSRHCGSCPISKIEHSLLI